MSVPDYVNRPTDGNPAAPILPVPGLLRKPWNQSEAYRDWQRDYEYRGRDLPSLPLPNTYEGQRAVHAGSTAHDTEAAS